MWFTLSTKTIDKRFTFPILNFSSRQQIESGEYWDELKVLECADQLRSEHWSYIGNSFPPTAAFGTHATDSEYRPNTKTNVKIGDDMLRVSYGSQYLGRLYGKHPQNIQTSIFESSQSFSNARLYHKIIELYGLGI